MAQYQVKLKQLLEKLQIGSCKISCDTYLNKLLTHISDKEKTQNSETGILLDLPVFLEWTVQVTDFWHAHQISPPANVVVFTLNLVSLLSREEFKFCFLNNQNFYIKLFEALKVRSLEAPPSIKLAYIRILLSFLEHKSGVQWMMNGGCNFWEDILQYTLISQTIYVTKESRRFIAKLLHRTIEYDENENFVNNAVGKIMKPLLEFKSKSQNEMEVDDEIVYQEKSPTIQLIGDILEYYLENSLFSKQDFRVISIFCTGFSLEQRILQLILISRNKLLVFDLYRIVAIMHFLELYYKVVNGTSVADDIENTINKFMAILNANLERRFVDNVLKFCHLGHSYWNLMGYKIPCLAVNKNNEPLSFANQLIVFQILPVCALQMKYMKRVTSVDFLSQDELRDAYLQKIFKMMCPQTLRIAYSFRNFLMAQPNVFEIATKAVLHIMESRKFYPREKAATVFQVLIYSAKDFVLAITEKREMVGLYLNQTNYLCLHFEALAVFIQEFHLTWKDSVETICVMAVSCDFLALAPWPSNLVVKVLKLVNIAFVKYMTPNLALLVDKMTDSSIALTGPLLCSKLMDTAWEVRDTALEVVNTMSFLSNTKFPSLQKVLMDSDLPGLVVKMAIGDGESFVRATAIKCLQEMIQVEEIWNNSLKSQDLSGKMRQILINETEGIVRVEAATFMCISYENNQFPEETLERVYETMIHSSTTDLHWEVKVRALNFWDKVINNHLQHQGMIDGSFPSVTFSKEHRKIVTLTDAEIKKRLLKVLGQLSSIGCLGVLISAIRDDCDMEVSKTAVKITQKLVELLKKYNIHGDCSVPTSPQPTENGMSSSASISSGVSGDDCMSSPVTPANSDLNEEIINQIVNSRDVNLLQNVYTPSDYGSVLNYDLQVRTIVSPNEFLLFTQQDLNVIINEKKNWLNGIEDLGSLLDDMLKSYDDDVNSMDCY